MSTRVVVLFLCGIAATLSKTPTAVAGPDLMVGHVFLCEQLGREGPVGSGTIGMGCFTTACNAGDAVHNWFGLPDVDHPVISLNLFRLKTVDGSARFEQIGQSWIKHGFASANANECNFGCTPAPFDVIGIGCSDTYSAGQIEPCSMGPRSVIHPYTGALPPSGSVPGICGGFPHYASRDHRDHNHTEISHRLQVQDADRGIL